MLLEPIGLLTVTVPNASTGDIMGDITKRRGRVLGMEPDGENHALTRIEAYVPMAEIGDYNTMLRASTQGRGSYQIRFDSYEEAPANVAQKVMETYKAEAEE